MRRLAVLLLIPLLAGSGLGPSLNDKWLPGFLIRFQARHGLGAMPAFDAGRVGGRELDDIVTYLGELRRAG
ncbi:MAG: cytochrome c [Alphaproteobacteria bacterium]|nr:cytochrome c [Alphaproteobacteria bacterium]MBF0375331.1 cytochrome c [Alphaproteobacteria bacterium]